MKIKFSRHAKRRGKLYGISEKMIITALQDMMLNEGKHEFVEDIPGMTLPLKIIVDVKNNIINVITNYPLKRGIKA